MKSINAKAINNALDSVLKQYGLDKKIKQLKVIEIWEEVVGDQISKVAKADRIERGILTIKVEKPVWRNELLYLKNEIIQKINKEMKEVIVKEIIFR